MHMISNFPTKKLYNPGGLRKFIFLPEQMVNSLPPVLDGLISHPFGLVPGVSWSNGYATTETLEFKEEMKDSVNGPIFSQEITGFVPGDQIALISLMQKMIGNPFIVQIIDASGQLRVAGSHGYPLLFSATFSTGSARSDAKGYQFKFSGDSIFSAPVLII